MEIIMPAQNNLPARTFAFAKAIRGFVNRLPKLPSNYEDAKQLVRSSGSVAANYLEAQEGVSRRDFFYRIKLCRKEARESWLWLQLLEPGEADVKREREQLTREADELKRIFATIAGKDDTE
jgi:four helix bundle protein